MKKGFACNIFATITYSLIVTIISPLNGITAQDVSLEAAAGLNKPYGDFTPPTTKTLALYGSRGEILNFMLKLEGSRCIRLKTTRFTASGRTRVRFPLRFFRMESIKTRQPSYKGAFVGKIFDPLLPLQDKTICPASASPSWFVGEIEIPPHATTGVYRALIRADNTRAIQINLTVWRMRMPQQMSFPAYAELSNTKMLLGHFGEASSQYPQLTLKYIQAMQAHRMFPIKSYVQNPPLIYNGQTPYLELYHLPSPETSFYSVSLQNRPLWTYFDFPTIPPSQAYEQISRTYFRAVQNTIASMDRAPIPMILLWDEPSSHHISELIKYAAMVKRLAPSLKLAVTVPGLLKLRNALDIFIPSLEYFGKDYASFADYRKLQKAGREIWAYVACGSHGCGTLYGDVGAPDLIIDRPPSYIRSLGWIASKYNLIAFYYYCVNYGYHRYPQSDPWEDLYDFGGNGDGTLFYPGRPGERGLHEHLPITSLRLKLWREASFDAEYLRWARELSPYPVWLKIAMKHLVKSPQVWDRNYVSYQKLRNRIGNLVHRLAP